MRERAAQVGLVGLVVALQVVAIQRVVTTTYVLNFSTVGPNATALLTLLLVTGWTVPATAALWRDTRLVTATLVGLVATVAVSTAHAPVLALVGAVGTVTLGTPLLVGLLQALRTRVAIAGALGVTLFLSLRAWLDTAPAYVTPTGQGVLVALAVAALALWVGVVREEQPTIPDETLPVPPTPLVAFLWLQAAFLGAPAALATWAGRSYPLTATAAVAGLVAGAAVVDRRGAPDGSATVGWVAVFVAATAALLWTDVVAGASAFPAHLAAVVLLARGSATDQPRTARQVAVGVTGLQLLALCLLFLHVGALNWAFMPAPVDTLTQGRLSLFLFGTWLLLPATAAASVLHDQVRATSGEEEPASSPPTTADADRRAVLGVTAAGLVGLTGVGVRESLADTPSVVETGLTVMSYNVHQFLEPGGDYSHRAIRDVIAAERPHVVGLQESESGRLTSGAHDAVGWLAHELGYHYTYGTTTSAGSYGVALLSRWPIVDERVVYLPVGNSPPYPALVAELNAPDGRLPVVVTHLQTQRPGHRQHEEAELVVDLASEYERAIVLGDFNARPDPDTEETYRIMSDALTDAWRAAEQTTGNGDTYSATNPRERIDYVWLTDDWSVRSARAVGVAAASDHRAVVATLRSQNRANRSD